jgi:teichoic acid glycerol-phosphate primase
MKNKTLAAFIFADNAHYLDHLAPLCALLDISLFVTHEKIYQSAQNYYPNLTVELLDINTCTAKLTKEFDIILTNLPHQMFDQLFFFDERVCQKKLLNIWVPHGNSDKGLDGSLGQVLKKEKLILYYGQKFLHEICNHDFNPRRMVLIGNYRHLYFQEHANFYAQKLHKIVAALNEKVILFAPSWEHKTLETCIEPLLESLKSDTTLLIKPHPNSLLDGSLRLEKLVAQYSNQAKLILDDTPIYPLLSISKALITDTSSIGYDFLYFNRPLILIDPKERDHRHQLHSLGPCLFQENIHLAYTLLEKKDEYETKRKKALTENFDKTSAIEIKRDLFNKIDKYYKQEVHTL